jgi:hypothetical protein
VPISQIKMYKDFDKNDIDAIQKFYDIFSNYNIVD